MVRHVNTDELMVLAAALGCSPVALLLPPTLKGETEVTGAGQLAARDAWRWVRGRSRLPQEAERLYALPDDDESEAAWDEVEREKELQFRRENSLDDPPVTLPSDMSPEQMNQVIVTTEELKKAGSLGLNTKAVAAYAQAQVRAERVRHLVRREAAQEAGQQLPREDAPDTDREDPPTDGSDT